MSDKVRREKSDVPAESNCRELYPRQLEEYVEQALDPDEVNVYKTLQKSIVENEGFKTPQELMLLDVALHDFIRIKRLQSFVMQEREIQTEDICDKDGNVVKTRLNVNPASKLLNSIETQFRMNMKEAGLTRKEELKSKLLSTNSDFAKFFHEDATPTN